MTDAWRSTARLRLPPVEDAAVYFAEAATVLRGVNGLDVDQLAGALADLRDRRGRVFVCGLGGSAAHASHLVNDLRKLCQVDAFAPTDNVAEFTARANDEGWATVFVSMLRAARLGASDAVLFLSASGGMRTPPMSTPLLCAAEYATIQRAARWGIIGRGGGALRDQLDLCVTIPDLYPDRMTPHAEGTCAVVWHCLVSHARLARIPPHFEATVVRL